MRFLHFAWVIVPFLSTQLCAEKNKPSLDTIPFTVVSYKNPYRIYRDFQPMMDYLRSETGIVFELQPSESYETAVQDITKGDARLAYLGPVTYIIARQHSKVLPIVQPLGNTGQAFFFSLALANKNDADLPLDSLLQTSLCLCDAMSTSGSVYPHNLIRKELSGKKHGRVIPSHHHGETMRFLREGVCKVGFVKDIIFERGDHQLEVRKRSLPIPTYPIVSSPQLPKELHQKIRRALLTLTPEKAKKIPFAQQLNPEFRYGFVESKDSNFNEVRKIYEKFEDSCSTKEKGKIP